MTEEDKELVLIDICGRLLHNVVCSTIFGDAVVLYVDAYEGTIYIPCNEWVCDFKPYLRPMEDMTEEEVKELYVLLCDVDRIGFPDIYKGQDAISSLYDWLNKKMFDYRGLIPKGLALPAPKGMYK